MFRFIAITSSVGLIIPCVFAVTWSVLEKDLDLYRELSGILNSLQLMVWPSSFFMMATAGYEEFPVEIFVISTIVNIALYALIGSAFWFGVKKQRWILYYFGGLISLYWMAMATL